MKKLVVLFESIYKNYETKKQAITKKNQLNKKNNNDNYNHYNV